MDIKLNINLWLIRIYALTIIVVVFADILEGAAFKLVMTMAVLLIILQSFFITRKKPQAEQTQTDK
ncbi:hypothetical protein C0580_01495 [Candidatus Parcubacteria bacterium]|nr:MAG: hypothetical protein C0580_01495 [Candidatus Parcubacteria bacterium]